MNWSNPLPYVLKKTQDSESFKKMPAGETGLPLAPHPGAFGVTRKYHRHEGIDIYVPECTPVTTVEEGKVLDVRPFTGEQAGLPWWKDTYAVFVEGESGVVVYGEIAPHVQKGQFLMKNELLGVVIKVLKKDKGRPMSMLHLELRAHGCVDEIYWTSDTRHVDLRDPTPYLLHLAK